jgi:hypothetical protein
METELGEEKWQFIDGCQRQWDRLPRRLTRQDYNAKVLPELLNAKPREIKSFRSGHLAPGRTQELQSELLAAGIPL